MFLFCLIMFNIKEFRHPPKKLVKKIMWQFNQNELCPPLALAISSIRLGMVFTKFLQISGDILSHILTMVSRYSFMLFGEAFLTSRLTWSHKCSIGFKSGDCAGHSNRFMWGFLKKSLT